MARALTLMLIVELMPRSSLIWKWLVFPQEVRRPQWWGDVTHVLNFALTFDAIGETVGSEVMKYRGVNNVRVCALYIISSISFVVHRNLGRMKMCTQIYIIFLQVKHQYHRHYLIPCTNHSALLKKIWAWEHALFKLKFIISFVRFLTLDWAQVFIPIHSARRCHDIDSEDNRWLRRSIRTRYRERIHFVHVVCTDQYLPSLVPSPISQLFSSAQLNSVVVCVFDVFDCVLVLCLLHFKLDINITK